jgi:hypothetical protein
MDPVHELGCLILTLILTRRLQAASCLCIAICIAWHADKASLCLSPPCQPEPPTPVSTCRAVPVSNHFVSEPEKKTSSSAANLISETGNRTLLWFHLYLFKYISISWWYNECDLALISIVVPILFIVGFVHRKFNRVHCTQHWCVGTQLWCCVLCFGPGMIELDFLKTKPGCSDKLD